jgi:hypothetical protein
VNISVADRILIIISSAGSRSTSIFLIVIAATLPNVLVTDPKNLAEKRKKESICTTFFVVYLIFSLRTQQ